MTTTTAPRFDVAAIMRDAWAEYRNHRGLACLKDTLAKGFRANRRRWQNCLRAAWARAREAVRAAALSPVDAARERVAKAEAAYVRCEGVNRGYDFTAARAAMIELHEARAALAALTAPAAAA